MHETFIEKKIRGAKSELIATANTIIQAYQEQNLQLTLRQLYYQFVARGFLANQQRNYKLLGEAVNDGRLCGLIDWNAIVDHTRNVHRNSHWSNPSNAVNAVAAQYQRDKWATQPRRVEIWIEKEALLGVFEGVCAANDCAYFCCRGYTGQSAMYEAAKRHEDYEHQDQQIKILHFGDHDPSGIDMTRDIQERLVLLSNHSDIEVIRVALNMDQIEEFDPPPNPAKLTDTRADKYVAKFGNESWELDALEPGVLQDLVQDHIDQHREHALWDKAVKQEQAERKLLKKTSEHWSEVEGFLKKLKGKKK